MLTPRSTLTRRIVSALDASPSRIPVLVGGCGSGRTTLLQQLRDRLGRTSAQYIDVERTATTPERFLRAIAASGKSWLFFGDRHYTHDFLYQLEWQDALKDGSLTRIDLAFSRDTPQKVYVQHRLWERRCDLVEWLDNGAQLYVCGDAKAMAKDVRAALVAAYADVKALSPEAAELAVTELERGHRYHQDVY